MITVNDFRQMLKIEHELIHQKTSGLSLEDSLIQPQPKGNCMNWVLGHLLEGLAMLEALGNCSPFQPGWLSRYGRESEPILGLGEGVLTLDDLLAGLDEVHQLMMVLLKDMDEEIFDEVIIIREKPVIRGWRVFFLHFHYTYHIGQLELLRQLAGRTEKVI